MRRTSIDFLEEKLNEMEPILRNHNVMEYFDSTYRLVRNQIEGAKVLFEVASKKSIIISLGGVEWQHEYFLEKDEPTVDDIHRAICWISLKLEQFRDVSKKI